MNRDHPKMDTPGSVPVLAMDGPSGSGKGTISRRVADALGWHLLDSGALYRLVALSARDRGLDLDDEAGLAALAEALDVRFEVADDGAEIIRLEGVDVSAAVREERTGEAASRVAVLPAVRQALVRLQRDFRQPPGLVADGRDMGTVIFPEAALKVFLTASPEERAERRHKQLIEKGISVSLADLFSDVQARDKRDAERQVSPLKPAGDAVVLDTTGTSIEDVTRQVLDLVRDAGLAGGRRQE